MEYQQPLISICIPSYNRTEYLIRLLNSITIQNFKNYEIIISDDSPGDEVLKVFKHYQHQLPISYFHNITALGTPANWNRAISLASGQWIKLMHDDDALANEDSLMKFLKATEDFPEIDFFYSGYCNSTEEKSIKTPFASRFRFSMMKKVPASLLSKNIIGPPSTTLIRNTVNLSYDEKLKWLVDIDFYISVLKKHRIHFISEYLIDIGINDQQVTRKSSRVAEVEIPEFFIVHQKLSAAEQQNIFVYDAAWRLLRNFNISSTEDIYRYGFTEILPKQIEDIIRFQKKFPSRFLKFGPISKILMLLAFSGKTIQ